MRTHAALLLLLVATVVRADDSVYPDRSNAYEYAGVILRTTNGKFRVSRPDTDYRGDAVQIDFDNDYAGYEVVADYHTHPCLPYSHWPAVFSDRDANSNDFDSTVGYIGDLCSGVIRRYVPGVTPRDMSWSNSPLAEAIAAKEGIDLRCSHGEAIGQIALNPKLPVLQEIPGPKTKARGLNCW